jgi:hypothetical protein
MANCKTFYTRDAAASIVELFENVLDKYNIYVPSPEDDERCPEFNNAKLYGSVYSDLLDTVEANIIDILKNSQECPTVISNVFSGNW